MFLFNISEKDLSESTWSRNVVSKQEFDDYAPDDFNGKQAWANSAKIFANTVGIWLSALWLLETSSYRTFCLLFRSPFIIQMFAIQIPTV